MLKNSHDYHVRAVHCHHLAGNDEVYEALKRATAPLKCSWDRLKSARRICIKINQDWPQDQILIYEGQNRELVSENVARATLRLLRENTTAELFVADASWHVAYTGTPAGTTTTMARLFKEFDVECVDANQGPIVTCPVPGGGLMFNNYFIAQSVINADAIVSVQKMKNHAYMGITLSLKNLFGLMPTDHPGRPRNYFHHLVRMPYMLSDIGRIFNPALNIIDALVGQAGREWGGDEARIMDTVIAGDHTIATDTCGATLMGHDPQSDWLTPPFHRDRNALLVAAQNGWGSVDLNEIDFQSEVQGPLAEFHAAITDPQEMVVNWRRTTSEQGLYYRDHQKELVGKYAGEYILLQNGEVRWHDPSGRLKMSRRLVAGDDPQQALWFKYVDPDEIEDEQYTVYEKTLQQIQSQDFITQSEGKVLSDKLPWAYK